MCLSATVFGQANECEKFKNGKFKIVDPKPVIPLLIVRALGKLSMAKNRN